MIKKILSRNFLVFGSTFLFLFCLLLSCNEKKNAANEPTVTDTTNQLVSNDSLFAKYELGKIKLPPGFKISVYAEVPNARSLCWGANGTLFVGNTGGNSVYAIADKDKNGVADKVYKIASGLNTPCGVAFRNGSLYVAEIGRILRFDDIENNLQKPPAYKVVYDKLPTDKWHGWKFIAFGPDDKLYVPVGAPCNVCIPDSLHACLTRMNPDGTGFEVYARGIRNTVGFSWQPQTKELWFTDNGRDELGDNIPSDELNTAPKAGMHFGFPYCHQGDILDPQFGKGKNCSDYTPPVYKLGPHVASLGMRFYRGQMFPAEYRNQIFVAEHGSWNRSKKIGYNITMVKIENNKATQAIPFATGWLQADDKVIGRPVDVIVAADGALLVSDDSKGAVYRITYGK
jgi:glucose/arabinose dehydrogenase